MYGIVHADGSGETDPPITRLSDLYDELANADQEHGDVAVVHDDTGWCISAHRDGRVVFEQVGEGTGERHMIPVTKEKVLELWAMLVNGEITKILKEPWKAGYGS